MQVEEWPLSKITPYPGNARKIDKAAVTKMAASLDAYGARQPIVVDKAGVIVVGHRRLLAAAQLGWATFPVHVATDLDDAQLRAYRLLDNKSADDVAWDEALLATELAALDDLGEDLALTGFSDAELDALLADLGAAPPAKGKKGKGKKAKAAADAPAKGSLVATWGVPPFSVFDARQGYWQERRQAWIARGLDLGAGRGAGVGETYNLAGTLQDSTAAKTDVSLFDPALCEILLRWFCPPKGVVLDPFAGGPVRGVVAAALGRRYVGVDLRPEQNAANRAQAAAIAGADAPAPEWIDGDSRNLRVLTGGQPADFVLTCPPYGDLERYSDDPRDLSTLDYDAFLPAYRAILRAAVRQLRADRFAAIVVGDFRDAKGLYRSFVADTVAAFALAGAALYNEAVLLTPTGSAGQRANKQFGASRKLVKVHQNVLLFVKGDPVAATKAIGAVDGVAEAAP